MANKVKQQGAIRPILASAPAGLAGVFYWDSGLSKLRFHNGSSFAELADFVQLQSSTTGSSGATKIKGDNKSYTNISGLSTFTLQDFLDRIDVALGTSGGSTFDEAAFRIYQTGSPTTELSFVLSALSADRSITMPDADVNLGALTNSNISATAAIAYNKLNLSGSIVNADVSASAAIAYSKLSLSNSIVNADVNASAAIAYSKLNLSASIVNADINAAAAIAYSKLNLSGSIVNADVATAAAIARSKLASGTANRIVVNDGTGVMVDAAAITAARALISDANGIPTHSSVTSTELGYLSGVTSAIQSQIDGKLTKTLADGSIFIGNVSNVATAQAVSGDISLSNAGVAAISAGVIVNADINASAAIAYSKLDLSASIVNADIASGAAIALNKLASVTASRALQSDASGFVSASSVTSTELGYVSGVTSSIQTQLGNKIDSSEKGANNGVATLDAGGKVPVSQLPNSVMEYKGTWNANTNSPTLADGTGNAGDVYVVSVAGSQDLGSGSLTFAVGDWVMYNGSIWEKSSSSNAVTSVNGQTGAVSLSTTNISEGSNLYFTDERAQDAVGAMVANSSKVSLTYVDGTPSLTADIVAGSLVNADINASAAIAYSKLSLTGSIVNADINASAAIAYSKLSLTGSIVNADVSASAAIVYSKLSLSNSIVNADIASAAAIAYSKLSLSNSIVDADINASAAIAYSKLALSGSIVNADIASAAAIAFSKMASLTASRALVSDGSGVVSVSSVTSTELGYVSGVTSSIQTQLGSKLANVVEDTTPQLGGTLDPNGQAISNTVRFGASAANSMEQDYFHALSLTASTTAVLSNLTFDSKVYKSLMVTYTCRNGNDRRTGTIMVSADNVSGVASSNAQIFHEELDTADLGLSWSAAMNGDNVEVSYTTGAGTFVANMKVERFKA